jgi:hypothetical protein
MDPAPKCHEGPAGVTIEFQREERQSVQLLAGERAEVRISSGKQQRRKIKELRDGKHGNAYQAEERREQRQVPLNRSQELVEDENEDYVAQTLHQVSCKPQPEQHFRGLDPLHRGGRVVRNGDPQRDVQLTKSACDQ